MKPNQLKAFVAVATQTSIRGAAQVLGVTPPAVTKIVRELEREVGAPLIERSVKGIALTECGAALVPRARRLLDDMRQAHEAILQVRDGAAGHIRVAVSTAVAQTLFVPAFRALRQRRPNVSVHVSESSVPGMLARLRDAQVDLVVAHVGPTVLNDAFECLPLIPTELVVGVRNRHPLRNRRSIHDLMEAEWVLPGDGNAISASAIQSFSALGLPTPPRVIQSDSITTTLTLVAQMDLVGMFAGPLVTHAFKHLGLRRMLLKESLPNLMVCVIHSKGSPLTPAALQFIDCVRDAATSRDASG